MASFHACFIGDSIVFGRGDSELLGWPGRLCKQVQAKGHDVTCYNLGVRGDTSELIQARWRSESEARFPDSAESRLVLSFGINDTAIEQTGSIRVPLDRSIRIARTLLNEATDWKPTLWVGPTPIRRSGLCVHFAQDRSYAFNNNRIDDLDRAYAAFARESNIAYLRLFPELIDDKDWHAALEAGDGIHPVDAGHARLSRRVADWGAWKSWFT